MNTQVATIRQHICIAKQTGLMPSYWSANSNDRLFEVTGVQEDRIA